MIRAFQSFFSRTTNTQQQFSTMELRTPQQTPPNTPRSESDLFEGSLAPPLEPLENRETLLHLFRPIFSITGDAKEKEGSHLRKHSCYVLSEKHQTMKKKVFFVHPSALDDGSQDASANPALQMVENEVKRNKKGEPKFYVLLSPKKADNPFSQFHPDRMQILDQAYRLGLTPKKYTLFEPVHPTEPKESFIECSSALLLQFVNGGDLLNFLCDHLELSFDEKLDLALQALRLVIQLHDNQIAHLDLKPENFLVYIREGRYELKLADFGFAKNAKNGDNTTTDRCYSPGYMPPEFAQSYWIQKKWRINYKFLPLDGTPLPIFKLDEWSLGATLFFILFGSRYEKSLAQNFQGHAPFETIEAFIAYKQSLSDRMVRGFCASFAPKVAQLLIGLLQYDPEKRLSAKESLENFTKS